MVGESVVLIAFLGAVAEHHIGPDRLRQGQHKPFPAAAYGEIIMRNQRRRGCAIARLCRAAKSMGTSALEVRAKVGKTGKSIVPIGHTGPHGTIRSPTYGRTRMVQHQATIDRPRLLDDCQEPPGSECGFVGRMGR